MERESDRLHCEKNMRIRGASTDRGGKPKSMKLQIASDPFAKANVPDGIMERRCAFCNTLHAWWILKFFRNIFSPILLIATLKDHFISLEKECPFVLQMF